MESQMKGQKKTNKNEIRGHQYQFFSR